MTPKKSKAPHRPRDRHLRTMYDEALAVLRLRDRHDETEATALAAAHAATLALEVDELLAGYKGAARRAAIALADKASGLGMAYTRMMAIPALQKEQRRAGRAEFALDRQPSAGRRAAERRHHTPTAAERRKIVADASLRYSKSPIAGRRAACLGAAIAARLTDSDATRKDQRAATVKVLRWCERFNPNAFPPRRPEAHARM